MSRAVVVRCLWSSSLLALVAGSCTNGDDEGPTCKAQSVVFADYSPAKEEAVQEDVDDPDMIMHLQMRVAVDIPPDEEKHQHDSGTRKLTQRQLPGQGQRPSAGREAGSGPAVMVVERSVVHSWDDNPVFDVIQTWARSLPLLQIATVLGIIATCLLLRKAVNVAEQTVGQVVKARRQRLKAQFDPSARLQQLLRALRFEPSCEGEAELLPKDVQGNVAKAYERKLLPKEAEPLPKEVQHVSECDPGNNTEEEPEAEVVAEPALIAIAKHCQVLKQQPATEVPKEGVTQNKKTTQPAKPLATGVGPQKKAQEIGLKVQVITC